MLRTDYKPQSIRQSGQLLQRHSSRGFRWAFTGTIIGILLVILSFNSGSLADSHASQLSTENNKISAEPAQQQLSADKAKASIKKLPRMNIELPPDTDGRLSQDQTDIADEYENAFPRRALPLSIETSLYDESADDENPNTLTAVTVQAGDSLARIFQKQSIPARDLQNIMSLGKPVKALTKMMPGTVIEFVRDRQNTLIQIRYPLDETDTLIIDKKASGYHSKIDQVKVETELVSVNGVINDSLFLSGKAAGLSDNLIMQLAGIFGWDIDFVLDIRKGDRFTVVYEKRYAAGEFLGNGAIVAAEFVNQGKSFRAVQFVDDKGNRNYFTPEGYSMRKAFLRAPLNFLYVSSGFKRKRFHPILKRVKAHRGIDYRAPKGTPVYAAGDGKVIRSGYNKYNGNYVFIKHGEKYVTKYLHFSRRKVRTGQRVKQGQTIGYVGMTGLAEAPHLHYEFLVNGVHRNPRTVKLPQARPIDKKHRTLFTASTRSLIARLDLEDRIYLAQLDRINRQQAALSNSEISPKSAPQ